MSEIKSICLLGYSGHAHVALDVIEEMGFNPVGYFAPKEAAHNPYNLKYLGFEKTIDLKDLSKSNYYFPAIGDNLLRIKAVHFIESNDLKQINLIAASAIVSPKATLATSVLIGPGAIINSMAKIAKGCIVNSGAVVEHGCVIGDFGHIAPAAVLAGNVKLGKNVFVGANAVIKESIVIGDNVVIGAGTVVLSNLPSDSTWVGNPARRIR